MGHSKLIWAIAVLTALAACSESDTNETPDPFSGIYQWADTVYGFSSEYNATTWDAKKILGKPTLWPEPCECPGSWAQRYVDAGREYIEIGFLQHNAPASSLAIFENSAPGAIDTVYVRNPGTGLWQIVWQGTAFSYGEDSTRLFVVSFPKTNFNVTDVRLAVASDSVEGWNEYDAVAISGTIFPAQYDTSGTGSFHD